MQWSEVTKAPPAKMLRQFAGLCLVVFVGLAGWRVWRQGLDTPAMALGTVGVVVGAVGLLRPMAIRWIYTGWMVAAFPIGWTLSHVVLGAMYYLIFTPVATVFRLMGRDALRLRRGAPGQSYWTPKAGAGDVRDYFRQF